MTRIDATRRRHRPLVTLVIVATTVTMIATGCGTGGTAKANSPPNPREPIQRLLRDRSERLNAGDVEGYLAPLSPEARAFEEPIARGLLTVPIARIDLTIGDALVSDDGNTFKGADVTLLYRYRDLPEDNPFRIHLAYDIERRGDSWLVTRAGPAPKAPALPIWATGPVVATKSEHFLVISRPGLPGLDEAVSLAERSQALLFPKLTLTPDNTHLLFLAADPAGYAEVGGQANSEEVAFASWVYIRTAAHPTRPEERSMAADLSVVLDRSGASVQHEGSEVTPEQVFQHELAHLALSRFQRRPTPRWVSEGGAMLLSGERRAAEWRALAAGPRLDAESVLSLERPDADALDYGFANAATSYLVEKFGAARFFDFFQNFKEFDDSDTREVRSSGAERLLRRYFRFGVSDLDQFTRDWIRAAVR